MSGSRGAPGWGWTWVLGSDPVVAVAVAGVNARTAVRQRAQVDMAIRGENPIVIPANVGTKGL